MRIAGANPDNTTESWYSAGRDGPETIQAGLAGRRRLLAARLRGQGHARTRHHASDSSITEPTTLPICAYGRLLTMSTPRVSISLLMP